MPIRKWIEKDRRRIRAVVSGDVATAEMIEAIDEAVRDPDYEPGFDILSDHSAVGEPLNRTQVEELTRHLAKLSRLLGGVRWAVVTTRPASLGMIRMLSVLGEEVPLRIEAFGSLAEAEAWLAGPSDAEAEKAPA